MQDTGSRLGVTRCRAGQAAVEMALEGKNAIMPCVVRGTGKRYTWSIGEAPLKEVANREKKMPRGYITRDGFGITDAAREVMIDGSGLLAIADHLLILAITSVILLVIGARVFRWE